MKSRIFSLLFAVLGLVSCEFLGTLPDAPQPTPDGPDSSLLLSDEAAFLKAKENPDTEPSNRFVIDSLWVEADAIKVQVSYGGGCQAHHFQFIYAGRCCTNPAFISLGPYHELILRHQANEDRCEAYLTQVLSLPLSHFDLSMNCEINAPHSFYLYSGDLSQTKSLQVNAACPGEPEDCHTLVKIKDFSCAGNGYFGSLYFQEPGQQMSLRPVGLQDGKQYLVPIQLDKDATYRIGYRKATAAEVAPYDSAVVCMMYVGPSTPVVITCLEKVMEPEPGIIQKDTVVADDVICGWGIWEGIWFRPLATDGPYLQPTELTDALIAIPQPQAGQKYVIGYSPGKPYQADEQVICQAYPGPSTPIRVHSLIPIH